MAENNNNPNQVADTGHEWDGIRELQNPCPRWWLNSLYLSGLLVILYFILYPSLPLVNDSTKGLLGWTMIKEFKEDLAKVEAKRAPFENQLAVMSVDEILADQEMLNYAIGSSKVLYGDNCAACHGTGGTPPEGSGYPVLADDDWLFGGSINDIMMSIAKGRMGMMPAHADLLTDTEVDQLVELVINASMVLLVKLAWLCIMLRVVSLVTVLKARELKLWVLLTWQTKFGVFQVLKKRSDVLSFMGLMLLATMKHELQ